MVLRSGNSWAAIQQKCSNNQEFINFFHHSQTSTRAQQKERIFF
jgi:hypothetical protein